MYNSIIITRSGHPGFERAVLVEQGTSCWLIDPYFEVSLATRGEPALSRNGCIISFMDGLVAANHKVILRERRRRKYRADYVLTPERSVANYHYFLFGLAWGKNQWWPLRTQLERTVVSTQRLAVLTATGQYYATHRWEARITLRVPII